MANHSPSKSNVHSYDQMNRLSSSTLKRNPKLELSNTDLLKMLGHLEGELQGREIAIATLKAEKVKQLLYQAKYGKFGNDPFAALQRDSFGAYEKRFDENAIKGMYDNQLKQLENLIAQHRNAQYKLKKQLNDTEKIHIKMLSELEDEKRKHAQDTAQGDDVTYLLEKERERLNKEIEFEKSQNHKMEKDLKKSNQVLEQERQRQKQIVLLLLAEIKRLMNKLLDERQKNEQISMILHNEKSKIAEMVDGLEEESKKSLQMEAEMERQLSEFDTERGQLHHKLTLEENKSKQLQEESERLRRELEATREQLLLGTNPNIRVTQSGLAGAGLAPPRSTPRPTSPKPPGLNPPSSKPSIPPKVGAALQQRVAMQNNNGGVNQQPPGVPPKVGGTKVFKVPSPTPAQRIVGNVSSVAPEVASKISVSPVVAQMATDPSNNRFATQDGIPDIVATHPQAPPNARITPNATPIVSTTTTRVFNSKVNFQSNVKQQSPTVPPPKKQPMGRGAPPPVPPNKPVITPHQMMQKKETITKGLTTNRNDVENTGVVVEVSSDEIGQSKEADNACSPQNNGVDILGQEYADFQQLLVSMVSGKG